MDFIWCHRNSSSLEPDQQHKTNSSLWRCRHTHQWPLFGLYYPTNHVIAISIEKNIYFCSFKNFDRDKFVGDLSAVPIHILEIFDDGDDLYVFEALYNGILDEHLPLHFNSNLKDISGLPGPFNRD